MAHMVTLANRHSVDNKQVHKCQQVSTYSTKPNTSTELVDMYCSCTIYYSL